MSSIVKVGKGSRSARAFLLGYLVHGIGSDHYDQGAAHTGLVDRAVAQAGDLTARRFVSYCEALPRRRQYDHLIVSFDDPGITPDQVADYGIAFARYIHPASVAHVVVHDDGDHHHLHAHIMIANQDEETGRSLQTYHDVYSLRQANDEMMGIAGRRQDLDQYGRKRTTPWRDQAATLTARASADPKAAFSLALGTAIDEALHDPRSVDLGSFQAVLSAQEDPSRHIYPVTMKLRQDGPDGPGITYSMLSDETTSPTGKPRTRSRRASKLCAAFQYGRLTERFATTHPTTKGAPPMTTTAQRTQEDMPIESPTPDLDRSWCETQATEAPTIQVGPRFVERAVSTLSLVREHRLDREQGHHDADDPLLTVLRWAKEAAPTTASEVDQALEDCREDYHRALAQRQRKVQGTPVRRYLLHAIYARRHEIPAAVYALAAFALRYVGRKDREAADRRVYALRGRLWEQEKATRIAQQMLDPHKEDDEQRQKDLSLARALRRANEVSTDDPVDVKELGH